MGNSITIEEAVKRALNTEKIALEKIANESERFFYLGFLENPNLVFACNFIFNEKSYLLAKNNFYTCALIKAYIHKFYNESIFSSHKNICYAILSDSTKVINRYLSYEDQFFKTFSASFTKAIQACINNDHAKLREQIELLDGYTKKPLAKNYYGCVDAFQGLLQGDNLLIEKGINALLAKHDKQEQPPVVKDYLNIEAITLAKLASRNGVKVNINNPLVPNEMIKIEELDKYNSYDILIEFAKNW